MSQDFPKAYLYRRIVMAKLYIDTHFAQNPDLTNIADEAFFSKFHFIRLFKMAYGKTPHQYLTSVRIEKAKALLQSEIKISEACYAVGFDSVSSFNHLFKRYMGVTPLNYQKQQMQRAAEMKAAPLKFIPDCFASEKGWV